MIAAGCRPGTRYQDFLRNPISTYIGDISYSLYLVHWPIIVFVGSLMEPGAYYSIVVVALSFALAITHTTAWKTLCDGLIQRKSGTRSRR